jgi:hypothetical protein
MSEHWALSWSVAEVDEPHDSQTRDPELHSRFGNSFGEIVRNRNSKKTKKFFAETNAGPEQAGSGPENNSDSENIALIALLSELPSKKDKALQEPTKASAQVEVEDSLDMTTSSFKTEQESTSSNCDFKGTRDALTLHWFQQPESWDDLCPAQEEDNKKDMYSFIQALYDYRNSKGLERRKRKKVQNDKKEHSRRSEPSRTLVQRVRQLLDRDWLAKCSIPL